MDAQNRKTYGRFLGMIFLKWPGRMVVPNLQRLGTDKIPENRKNGK
jgi:hypothetical protein